MPSVREDVEQPECSDATSGGKNWGNCFGKVAVLTKSKHLPSQQSALPPLCIYSPETAMLSLKAHIDDILSHPNQQLSSGHGQ
jgi:hypothetical protein